MGVQGLWTILEPAARNVKLETLAKKRLAVDASIWIYQFLKAVRDKEGQALRNSHIVGFFRRICKLLFFGIKPVFVFDGGAPTLKRQTLANRARRREGRKEDATRTAGKILALQTKRRAQMEVEQERLGGGDSGGDQLGDDVVYFGEIDMKPEERKRKFRKSDQYHLPNLEFPLERMAAPNDTRILTAEELEEYAKDYHALEDLSHYDFSSLDFDSDYFRSLPIAEQYSILNAARLRSRLRMGYSKEQLDDMFPDRLTFSRFQIQRLKERNDYTQRLMNLNGMNDVGPQRIAGEKGREYFLVRNEGDEGGWVLGTTDVGGAKEKPVLVDVEHKSEDEEDADDEFEDVPLENTQPEEPPLLKSIPQLSRKSQPTGYGVQTKLPFTATKKADEALFVIDDDEEMDELVQEGFVGGSDDDAELQAAINLSMQPMDSHMSPKSPLLPSVDNLPPASIYDDELAEVIALSRSQDKRPLTSSTNDTDLQTALALSREDQNLRKMIDLTQTDQSDFENVDLYEKFPLSAKDKGKGVARSPTPETHVSTQDEELLRAIELSKTDFAGYNHMDGVGPSTSFGTAANSPSRILGRSMFRKKQNPVPAEPIERLTQDVPSGDREALEITDEPASDVVLEEKMRLASPVPVPARTKEPEVHKQVTEPVQVIERIESTPSTNLSQSLRSWSLTPEPRLQEKNVKEITPAAPNERPTASDSQNLSQSQLPNTLEVAHSPQEEPDVLSDDEDEELMAQLAAEAAEHARFASSINPAASTRPDDFSYDTLHTDLTEEDFEKEMRSLRNQQKKDRRDADEVNQLMVVECQQLLRLFGLPYITAPMEAEAQCAELVNLGLVDGIVTDDSDIFLFGGTRVYKNMFNQGKFVECYLLSDLERDFNLDREKFINLAHLLGSDYAEGIPHVGPVNALELLSDFPEETGLEEFRDWWIAVQQGRLPKSPNESEFRRKFRKNLTKIFLPNDFPNRVIDQAYLKPEVDSDPQAFVWGVPDLDALRSFLMSQIGWTKDRTDEILVPIIKDMNRRQIEGGQTNLTDFFEGRVGAGTFAPRRKVTHRSKRMSKAMSNLRKQGGSDDDVQEISPRQMSAKRKRAPIDVVKVESDEERQSEVEEESSSDDDNDIRIRGERPAPLPRKTKKTVSQKGGNAKRSKKTKI